MTYEPKIYQYMAYQPEIYRHTLHQNRLGESPLHRAAAMGNVKATKFILGLHPNSYYRWHREVNAVDGRGRTAPWHAACADSKK